MSGGGWIKGLLAVVLAVFMWQSPAYGMESQELPDMSGYDFSDMEEFLKGEDKIQLPPFGELMGMLLSGNITEFAKNIFEAVADGLKQEVSQGGRMLGQILVLGLVGAVFSGFSGVFNGSQISETAFFITYLLLFCCLAAAFQESISIAADVAEKILEFMRALIPSYFLSVAWAGGSLTAAAWYGVVLFLISAAESLLFKLLIPLVRVYIMLVLAGHIAREDMLSRMTELLRGVICWSTKTLVGIVLGFHVIQGMVLPYADSVKTSGIQKLVQVIPGIGQGAGAVTQMVLGAGVLIKNTMGAAAVVILLVLAVIPLLKLLFLMVLYRLVEAVLQPVCDKRLIGCIGDVAAGHRMLFDMVFSLLLLFVVTIAFICAGTNVTYLA